PILRSRYDASLRPRVIPIAPATPMPAAAPAPRRAPAVPVMEEEAADASASTPPSMSAPPPPRDGTASGTVLDFGRYAGWTVGDLSRHDPDYLLWLERTPIGR